MSVRVISVMERPCSLGTTCSSSARATFCQAFMLGLQWRSTNWLTMSSILVEFRMARALASASLGSTPSEASSMMALARSRACLRPMRGYFPSVKRCCGPMRGLPRPPTPPLPATRYRTPKVRTPPSVTRSTSPGQLLSMISTRRPFSGLSRSMSCGVKSLLVLAFAIVRLPIRYPGRPDTPPRRGSQMGESVLSFSGKTKSCGRYRLREATSTGRMRATAGVEVARSGLRRNAFCRLEQAVAPPPSPPSQPLLPTDLVLS